MKAEDLLKTIEKEKDNNIYAGVKRVGEDYSSKRIKNTEEYLYRVGEVSKRIIEGLEWIKSKNISK